MKHLGITMFGAIVAAASVTRLDQARADGPTATQLQAAFAAGQTTTAG